MQARANKSILLIEDEPLTARVQCKKLQDMGYQIFHVSNGEDAIDKMKQDPDKFDMILSDIDLGNEMDGTQAAANILKIVDIPVLFLSSHTDPEIVKKTEQVSSYGYVVKDSGSTVLDISIKMAFRLFEERKLVRKKQSELVSLNSRLEHSNQTLNRINFELEKSREEILYREKELQESETRFRTLAEHVPGVIYLCHNDERFSMLYLNTAVEKLTGYGVEDFITDQISFVDLYHPEDARAIFISVRQALAEKQSFHLVYRINHRDGSVRWIEEYGCGIFEEENLMFLEGFLADITERKIKS